MEPEARSCLTGEEQTRFRNSVYQRTSRKVRERFKPAARTLITDAMIQDAVDRATGGISNFELAILIDHGDLFCERCGECCRRSNPITIDREDLAAIAAAKRMPRSQAALLYTWTAGDGRMSLRTKPCPFLRDNLCSIYAYRPKVCRGFPLTEAPSGEMTLGHYSYCSVPVNLAAEMAVGRILRGLVERVEPGLADAMKQDAERAAGRAGGLSQFDQIRYFQRGLKRDMKRAMELLEREDQG